MLACLDWSASAPYQAADTSPEVRGEKEPQTDEHHPPGQHHPHRHRPRTQSHDQLAESQGYMERRGVFIRVLTAHSSNVTDNTLLPKRTTNLAKVTCIDCWTSIQVMVPGHVRLRLGL
jgi:hypothetical protein